MGEATGYRGIYQQVFFVLLFHVIVPGGMLARKIYIFVIVIRQFLPFKQH